MHDRLARIHEDGRVESTLWWYQALHHLVLGAIRAHATAAAPVVIDAGCGTGGLMQFLRAHGLRPCAASISRSTPWPGARSATSTCGRATCSTSRAARRTFGRRDRQQRHALLPGPRPAGERRAQCAAILRPGGLLILNVPALRAFAGIHDISVGIRERFSRADTKRLLGGPSFEVVRERYWPFVLSPLIYAARAAQRRTMRRNKDFTVQSDVGLPPRWINNTLLALVRAENRLLPWKPFGSSLFLVAIRQPTSALSSAATRSKLASGSSG
jgi:hypothetical protein